MKITSILFLCFIVSSMTARAETQSLNGTWHFKTDLYDQGLEEAWHRPDLDPVGWVGMAVPGNWDLENEYADYAGAAWYRRTFETKRGWKGKRVRLYFESVYNDTHVWLNGRKIAENEIGFLPFWVDVQDHLKQRGDNVLVLRVDNTFKRGAIWNWGGIRRPVWLEMTPMARLERQHITAVPDLVEGTAELNIELKFSNAAQSAVKVAYRLQIQGPRGETVFSTEDGNALTVPAGGEALATLSHKLTRDETRLWHFNHPHLYTAKVELLHKGKPVQALSDRFGIRKVEADGGTFRLNGEAVRTVGFNLVAEDRTSGNTLPLWRIKEDVDMMKQLGANMARVSHLPLPREFLDYLDQRGIMTFEEVALWQKDLMVDPDHPTPKDWLKRMVEHKYNHPSIIGWSLGNEIGFVRENPAVMEYIEGAVAQAKELDPGRLAVYVTHSAPTQIPDPVQFTDMILYNSYGGYGVAVEKVHRNYPDQAIFMAEFGGNLTEDDPGAATIDAKKMLDTMRGRDYLMGASLWTFNDYRSAWSAGGGWMTPPSQNRTWGVVTTFREKKKPFDAFREEYAPVQSMTLQTGDSANEATVTLTPRGPLDLPAYRMRGYRLLWASFDQAGKVTGGSFTELPEIQPGDEAKEFPITLAGADAVRLEVHLLDPLDYSVLDTTVHFEKPPTPEILSVRSSLRTIRVVFEPVENATGYALRYRKSGEAWQQTEPTTNHFFEMSKLDKLASYDFAVLALNGAGEGEPTEIRTAASNKDELPPIIWKTVPGDGCFFVGYSVDPKDYLYEITIGEEPGVYTRTLRFPNVGVLKVPGLENGKTYYYKMRVRKQWGFASEWSREIAVTPDANQPAQQPEVLGLLSNGDKHILLFEPVAKATGYRLELADGKTETILTAQNGFFSFEAKPPKPAPASRLKLVTQNESRSPMSRAACLEGESWSCHCLAQP